MNTEQRNAEIIRLVKSGLSYGAVGAQMNVTRSVVSGVCNRAKRAGDRAAVSRATNVLKTKIAVEETKIAVAIVKPKPAVRVSKDDPAALVAAALISKATNAERARQSYLRSLSATTRVL